MTSRPTKRQRTRAVARRERQEGAALLVSVLLPIVQEGFLRHQELGQLGQTSRQLNHQCKRDLWKALCFYRWPNTATFTESKMESLDGYSGLYRFKIRTIQEEPSEPPPLGPPTLRPQDVEISVDITRGCDESLVSVSVNRDAITSLLEKGWARFQVRRPAIIGNAACFLQGTCSCDRPCRFNLVDDNFDVSMHLYRSGETPCRLYHSMKRNPCYRLTDRTHVRFPIDGTSKWWEKPRDNHIYLGPGVPSFKLGLPFRWTPMAAEIHRRLRASIYFAILPLVEVSEKQNVAAITGVYIAAFRRPCGARKGSRFDSTEQAKKHGVTLLHILQELQGIQLNSNACVNNEE